MVPEIEKARITEIHVRMDCNGCVQKIKKALHGINGIYNINIDFPRQKLTVIGWAEPEKIIKAIKKTRKIATICSHKEVDPPAPPPAPADGGDPPPPQPEAPPPADAPPASEPSPPAEPPKEAPPPPPQSETTTAPKEENVTTPPPAAATTDPAQDQPPPPSEPPKDVEEIHIAHHHPHQHYGYYSGGGGHGFPRLQEAGPYHVMTHNYNTYRPSSSVSEYYGYQRSPATQYIEHARIEYVDNIDEDNYHGRDRKDGNQITSIFSDENPNACTIS